jgi:deoxyribonuclease V
VVGVVRPEFVPDPALSRPEMEDLQREIARSAAFADDFGFDPRAVAWRADTTLAGAGSGPSDDGPDGDPPELGGERPLVAGVDQAFLDGRAVSAVVVARGSDVVERVHAVSETAVPYVPGLLSFREGGPILAAVERLEADPDLLLFDGSGRIHFREAGLATHVGVTLDRPSVGVAKSLLCGTPRESVEGGLPAGRRVAIEADDGVETADPGTVIGYAVQTRQFDSPNRHVNPLYVSPGHRVSAATAAGLAARCCGGYKLPEPIRLADAYADEAKDLVD